MPLRSTPFRGEWDGGFANVTQAIKDWLVHLGPQNALTRAALRIHGVRNGFQIRFSAGRISLRRARQEILLSTRDFYLVPITMECFSRIFEEMQAPDCGGVAKLDFSTPGRHRYKRHGLEFWFPGIPEDDSVEAYAHWYKPKPGDLVFDVGAHAGFTSCMFARMVGPEGRVVAFEPDAPTVEYLRRNVAEQGLNNIAVFHGAMDAKSGRASFNSDGTMGAGLVAHSVYGATGQAVDVETLSFKDACERFGKPDFVKMDIEGAELAVMESAHAFLREHSIDLAFDSYHRMRDGRFTWMLLEPMLRSMGYESASSAEFGQMFTWAKPGMRPI